MKKIVILLLITLLTAFGCTRIPASVETGVMPGEYKGLFNLDELKNENESLNKDLKETKDQLVKLKEDYLSLAKNSDITLKKLDVAESLLNVLKNEGLPKFIIENTDKVNISNYLNEKKSILDKNHRGMEIIPLESNDNIILFETIGYGDNYNQLFAWEIGKNEPILIEGAYYNKNGNWKWLMRDKYIIISSGNSSGSEKILVDIEAMKVINTFEAMTDDLYLIMGTSSIIMKKANQESSIIIYDFLTKEEKELNFDFKNKNLKFEVNKDNTEIKFTRLYEDDNQTEYSIQASMSIEKLKENYKIKTIEEITQKKSNEELKKIEENEKGAI